MNSEIKKLYKWSERHFATLCAKHGVTANPSSDEDETGWDYLLEFRRGGRVEIPEDQVEAEIPVRVQIKSKRSGKPEARVKLSNARRFSASIEPCFLVLMHEEEVGYPVKIYAKHIWKNEIERTLRRLRKAENQSKPVNQLTMSFRFSEKDRHDHDLLNWIESTALDNPNDYSSLKKSYFKNLGYEGQNQEITFRVMGDQFDALVDNSLGIGPPVNILDFRVSDKRFGIEASRSVVQASKGTIALGGKSTSCRLELLGKEDDEVLAIEARLTLPFFPPGAPVEKIKVKIEAGPLDGIIQGDGTMSFTHRLDNDRRFDVADLLLHLCALRIVRTGSFHVLVDFGDEYLEGSVEGNSTGEAREDFDSAVDILEKLQALSISAGNTALKLTLDEAYSAKSDIRHLFELVYGSGLSFGLGKVRDEAAMQNLNLLVGKVTIQIGDAALSFLLSFPRQALPDAKARTTISFAKPAIIKTYFTEGVERVNEETLDKGIDKYISWINKTGIISIRDTENERHKDLLIAIREQDKMLD